MRSSYIDEGLSIKKNTLRICSFAVGFFKNFELGALFFDKKSFYLKRNRHILRALDICNGLRLLGSHAKDYLVRFQDSN
jgi:hypothetical protein